MFLIVRLAFGTTTAIIPLPRIDFYNFTALESPYVFIYIGSIQIIIQGFLMGKISKRFGERNTDNIWIFIDGHRYFYAIFSKFNYFF